jgi:hypothetical protein
MAEQTVTDNIYASEVIDLPSKGLFYPKDSPLSSGQIDIKYMTAKEEDILTSTNLIQKGIVLDKLMDSLIVTKGVKSSDLLTGDLNAVMVAARILGYGKDYPITVACPACGEQVSHVVDLSTLQTENEPSEKTSVEFKIILPLSKAEIGVKLLTRNDELEMAKESKALKKAMGDLDNDTTSRIRAMITSVDGDTSKAKIWAVADNMLVRDARYLREQYKNLSPDIDFNIELEHECDTTVKKVRLPIGVNFFWPDA